MDPNNTPTPTSKPSSIAARPKTGVLAATADIVDKARAIAAEASKKTRPLQRKKEAIGLQIKTLEAAIESRKARIDRLRVKEIETAKQIETAEADAIAILKTMAGHKSDFRSEET